MAKPTLKTNMNTYCPLHKGLSKVTFKYSIRIRLLLAVFAVSVASILTNTDLDDFQFRLPNLSPVVLAEALPTDQSTPISPVENTALPKRDQQILIKNSFIVGKGASRRRVVIATAASKEVDRFVNNLRCFVRQTSKRDVVTFAMDEHMYAEAKGRNMPTIPWYNAFNPDVIEQSSTAKTAAGQRDLAKAISNGTEMPHLFGSTQFSGFSLTKLEIVRQVLLNGIDVLFTDVDTVWCRDLPKEFERILAQYPKYDMFIQSNQRTDDVLGQVNTGFYYAKANKNMLKMYEALKKQTFLWHNRSGDDQTLFWGFSCKGGRLLRNGDGVVTVKDVRGKNRFLCRWGDGSVQMLYLPIKEFPNGAADPEGRALVHVPKGYYRQACKQKVVSMWHVNYCSGSRKEHMLRRQDVWIADEDGSCSAI